MTPRSWPIVSDDDLAAVLDVVASGEWVGWKRAALLESDWAAYVGVPVDRVVATSSCATAIHLAIRALGLRGRIVVPAYTFVGTVHPVLWAGCMPAFADVDPRTGLLDVEQAERVTVRTGAEAVVVVHLHGQPHPDVEGLARSFRVVEDACQAHGATLDGRTVGTFGDVGAWSLNAVKNLPAGQGGLAVARDAAVADRLAELTSYGREDEDGIETVGYASGITEVAAALARSQLRRLAENVDRARTNAAALSRLLEDVAEVPTDPPGGRSSWHKYPLRLPPGVDRDRLGDALDAFDVPTAVWQRRPVATEPVYGGDPADFPGASEFVGRTLMIGSERCPLIAQDEEEVVRWGAAIRKLLTERGRLS